MFIQTETTPNPATIKFLPGQRIIDSGSYDFPDVTAAAVSPLARRLFGIVGVMRVFIAVDYVSVTKADDTDWSMLKPMILVALMEHLSTRQPVIEDAYAAAMTGLGESEADDEITIQIKELLDTRVRPMVARDGGDIVFDRFEDGIVYLRMQGACSGCPSSTATLKSGIESMLRHYMPQVQEVRAA